MAILLTGTTGFIGSNLLRALLGSGRKDVVVLLRNPKELNDVPHIHYQGNLQNLIEDFKAFKITGVVHLASLFLSQHTPEQVDSLIVSNITLGMHLAEAAHRAGCEWFLNTSTFWQNYENKEYSPVSLYAATKRAFEDILEYYVQAELLKVTHVHLFDSYGPKDPRPKVLSLLKKTAENKDSLGMSPGEQKINLVHVDDIVKAYSLLISKFESGESMDLHYTVSSEELITLRGLVKIFETILGKPIDIRWGERPYRPREIMDPQPIYPLVPGWKQTINLESGLKTILGS